MIALLISIFSLTNSYSWEQIDSVKKIHQQGRINSIFDYTSYLNGLQSDNLVEPTFKHIAALAYDSRSELPASLKNPRIFRFFIDDLNSNFFIGTYPKDLSVPVVQFLEYNKETNLFDWAEYDQRTNSFRESPGECLSCHKGPNGTFKPIWGAYPEWLGFLGGFFNGSKYGEDEGTSKIPPPDFELKALQELSRNRYNDLYLRGMRFKSNYYDLSLDLSYASERILDYSKKIALGILLEAAKNQGTTLEKELKKIRPQNISLKKEYQNFKTSSERMKSKILTYANSKANRYKNIIESNSNRKFPQTKNSYFTQKSFGVFKKGYVAITGKDILEINELVPLNLYYLDTLERLTQSLGVNFPELIPGYGELLYPVLTGGEKSIESYAKYFSIPTKNVCGRRLSWW